jgi:hypothetical protein
VALSGPLDHWAEVPPVRSLGGPLDHFTDTVPSRSLSGPLDEEAEGIPGRSLSGPLDHDATVKQSALSGPFDHEAEEADLATPVPSGTRALNPGLNLVVLNASPQAVQLGWTAITETDLADDDLITDVVTDLTAEAGTFPADILAGGRTVLGYRLHRGAPGFVPEGLSAGDGNCIADELELLPATNTYIDGNVLSNDTYAYRLALIISGA